MNGLGESFTYPFRSPGWAGRMLLQGLIALIPIIGWIAMTGWLMLAFENARAGRKELPPAGFHLSRGIAIFGIFFIYGFVLNIASWILFIAGSIASGQSHGAFNAGSPLTALGFLWGFLAGLFLNFLVPSLMINTYHGGFAGGMDVAKVWRLARANLTNSVSAGAIVWISSVIGGLGLAVCFFGIIFTIPYENAIKAGAAAWFEKVQSVTMGAAGQGTPAIGSTPAQSGPGPA
jgi:uncharacterized protein DUF4013